MNKNDSERIAGVLSTAGLIETSDATQADVVIINTCSIRQTAEDRVVGQVRKFGKMKAERPNMILAITGCMPGRDVDGLIRKKLPEVDLYFPIYELPQLPRWIAELRPESATNSLDLVDDYLKITPLRDVVRQAYVTISTGCNNFCTFCVVPYARGRERARPVRDILNEVEHLASRGCIEVTLLGQNVNTYTPTDPDTFVKENPYRSSGEKIFFAALLWEINQIAGIDRIHFTAPNPQDMTDAVIEALALPKHLNFLHLPVQSGSDRILKRMNRRHSREDYLRIVEKVRAVRPDIALATDMIVGFSGETEEDFLETVSLYRESDFDIAYTAMYSPRSGTVGARYWKDDVPLFEKKRRWRVLQDLMEETVLRKNQRYIDTTAHVLVDEFQEKGSLCLGNSREMKRVQFRGSPDMIGQDMPIEIHKVQEWMLTGSAQKTLDSTFEVVNKSKVQSSKDRF